MKKLADYVEPQIEIIQFTCVDIITTSVIIPEGSDENQGGWDPQ